MLVITRRPGEALTIGEGIRVVVLAVEGERVKLGIVAPRDIPVFRQELLESVREANQQATQAPGRVLEQLKRALTKSVS